MNIIENYEEPPKEELIIFSETYLWWMGYLYCSFIEKYDYPIYKITKEPKKIREIMVMIVNIKI